MNTREIIKVDRGINKLLAEKFKVSKGLVSQALRGDRKQGMAQTIRGAALKEYGGRKVKITEERINQIKTKQPKNQTKSNP